MTRIQAVLALVFLVLGCQPVERFSGVLWLGPQAHRFSYGIAFEDPSQHAVLVGLTTRPFTKTEKERIHRNFSLVSSLESLAPFAQITLVFKPESKEATLKNLEQYRLLFDDRKRLPVTLVRQHFDWSKTGQIPLLSGALGRRGVLSGRLVDEEPIPGQEPKTPCRWDLSFTVQISD